MAKLEASKDELMREIDAIAARSVTTSEAAEEVLGKLKAGRRRTGRSTGFVGLAARILLEKFNSSFACPTATNPSLTDNTTLKDVLHRVLLNQTSSPPSIRRMGI